MGNELSKSIPRRLRDPAFHQRYFVGVGLDVGAGGDSLSRYVPLFPRLERVSDFDVPGSNAYWTGDATLLAGVPDAHFDFVHSSHCLEHLADPATALGHWLRVTRPGGHVIVLIPDWEMYERETWPSVYNSDHKHCFTTAPVTERWLKVWGGEHGETLISVPHLLAGLGHTIVKLELLESTFLPGVAGDQTVGIGECGIEFVLRRA